ncbi:MAG: YihY family inner membrane protein [Gemmatimonadaceae bacterium]|nr:YihY family inner membrane protein [Gemmatimonadaceae bacterium]
MRTAGRFLLDVWKKAEADDVLFLGGGVAFAILLAGVPFLLLLGAGLGFVLGTSPDLSSAEAVAIVERLFPLYDDASGNSFLAPVLRDVVQTRGTVGLYGALAFVWFSTRLFGTLRTVLNRVFDVGRGRGVVVGKLFDIALTMFATLLVAAYAVLSAYLAVARGRGLAWLQSLGVERATMGGLEYGLARAVAFAVLLLIFFALYKYLPSRRIRARQAWLASLVTALLFEAARSVFGRIVASVDPGSIYTGTLAAVIVVVFWCYYGALIFLIGGEVAQVHERRRTAADRASLEG